MSNEVNISFVLDMQRMLYRWSSDDPDKVFADLFNLVYDRRTLPNGWNAKWKPKQTESMLDFWDAFARLRQT